MSQPVDENFQGTSFMDECMTLKLLSEFYNSDRNFVSCWVSPADTPSLVTGTFTLSSLDFSSSYGCSRNAAAVSPMKMVSWEDIPSVNGPMGQSSLVSEPFVHEVSCLYVGDTAPPASCHHGSSLQNAGSWSRFWSWGSVLWEILDISITTEPDIIFIGELRPLILLKYVKFSDQANTQSVSEKRAHGLLLTGILNCWHIHNVPAAEEQKTEKCVALTVTCNEWNSPREIRPGILESLNLTRPLSLLYDSVGLTSKDESFAEPDLSLISDTLLKKKKMKLQSQVSWAQDTKGSWNTSWIFFMVNTLHKFHSPL